MSKENSKSDLVELCEGLQVLLLHSDVNILQPGVSLYAGLNTVDLLEVGGVEDDEALLRPDLTSTENYQTI